MLERWKVKLRAMADRFRRKEDSEPAGTTNACPPLQLNLGIDFGTRFTKVCVRDVGAEVTRVVSFASGIACPSVVVVSPSGELRALGSKSVRSREVPVTYLKMRIAGMGIDDGPPSVAGFNLADADVTKALSSWFLADVIAKCKRGIARNESELIRGRDLKWTANVGVPVAHYDSPAISTFNEVLAVAWLWQDRGFFPPDIGSAVARYRETLADALCVPRDCHPVPEIAAAVQSFVSSREAVPDRYIYVDIGGGTVDAVVFKYTNYSGEKRVNFFAGEVQPLGTEPFLKACGLPLGDEGLSRLTKGIPKETDSSVKLKLQLENLLGRVLITARSKDGGLPWAVHSREGTGLNHIGNLQPDQMKPLRILLGGGGARIPWYRDVLLGAWSQQKLRNFGFPPFELLEIRCPKDLSVREERRQEYHRLAIAYGLSVPLGEGPDVGLPSQFEKSPPMPQWSPSVGNYLDSKDAYD
jgi:hypothetical protein